MGRPEHKSYDTAVEKIRFIGNFFKSMKGDKKINAEFTAQTIAAIQTMLQEVQFETRLEDWTSEEICEFVMSSEAFK